MSKSKDNNSIFDDDKTIEGMDSIKKEFDWAKEVEENDSKVQSDTDIKEVDDIELAEVCEEELDVKEDLKEISKNKNKTKSSYYAKDANKDEMVMYIVIDRVIPKLLEYMRECGLKVNSIMYDIQEAKNKVIIQDKPCRIVVIDTGRGKFTSMANRAEIVDLIGICSDGSKGTVFYSDSVLKVECQRALKSIASVDWNKYVNTVQTVAKLLSAGENYVIDEEDIKESSFSLDFIGESIDTEISNMGIESFSSELIIAKMQSEKADILNDFKIKI